MLHLGECCLLLFSIRLLQIEIFVVPIMWSSVTHYYTLLLSLFIQSSRLPLVHLSSAMIACFSEINYAVKKR